MMLARTAAATLALLGGLMAGPCLAETSEEYARLGKLVWSAFTCSTIAENSGQADEQRRLFEFGYETGKRFYEAALNGSITEEDWRKHVPLGITWRKGPTPEFTMGRVFEGAAYIYLGGRGIDAGLFDRCNAGCDKEKLMQMARRDFRTQNCEVIGR